MRHFNQLSPSEHERLAILIEELGEAIHIAGKILRHGYESMNPVDSNSVINRALLERELGDVQYAIIALCDADDLDKDEIYAWADKKKLSIKQWLHHQNNLMAMIEEEK